MKTLSVTALLMTIVLWAGLSAADTEVNVHLGAQFGVGFINFTGDGGTLPPFANVDPSHLGGGVMGPTVRLKSRRSSRCGRASCTPRRERNGTGPFPSAVTPPGPPTFTPGRLISRSRCWPSSLCPTRPGSSHTSTPDRPGCTTRPASFRS